jgi:hypothetical protein
MFDKAAVSSQISHCGCWNSVSRSKYDCLSLRSKTHNTIPFRSRECENSFAKSIIQPAKPVWESCLESALGCSEAEDYDILRSHSLQASHM